MATMMAPMTSDDIVAYLLKHPEQMGCKKIEVDRRINQVNFPLNTERESGEMTICDPSMGFNLARGEAMLKRQGLMPPTLGDALRFPLEHGATMAGIDRKHVVFLHKPWMNPDQGPQVISFFKTPDWVELCLVNPNTLVFRIGVVLAGIRIR